MVNISILCYVFIYINNFNLPYQNLAENVKPLIPISIRKCCGDFVVLQNNIDIDIDNEIEEEVEIEYNGGWFEPDLILLNITKEILNNL